MKLLGNFCFDNKFSIGDDNVMYKWNTNNSTASQLMQLDAFSVDHDWVPSNKGSSDVFAVGFADGSFRIYSDLICIILINKILIANVEFVYK
jgi:hypothetical protein